MALNLCGYISVKTQHRLPQKADTAQVSEAPSLFYNQGLKQVETHFFFKKTRKSLELT